MSIRYGKNNINRNVVDGFVGINGVNRQLVKVLEGRDGINRVIWEKLASGIPRVQEVWNE